MVRLISADLNHWAFVGSFGLCGLRGLLADLIGLHLSKLLQLLRELHTAHVRARLQLFGLSLMELPADELAHGEGGSDCLLVLELRVVERPCSQEQVFVDSLAPAAQVAGLAQFLQHGEHVHEGLELQSLFLLEDSDELVVGSGEVGARFAQSGEGEHLGTHASVPLVLGQQVRPVEFAEGALAELRPHQCPIRLEAAQVLPEQLLLVVAVMCLEGGDQQVEAVLLGDPVVGARDVPQLLHCRGRVN